MIDKNSKIFAMLSTTPLLLKLRVHAPNMTLERNL